MVGATEAMSLTYRELAQRLGITVNSARIKARRRKWRVLPGNHPLDPARVEVPADFLSQVAPRSVTGGVGDSGATGVSPGDVGVEEGGVTPVTGDDLPVTGGATAPLEQAMAMVADERDRGDRRLADELERERADGARRLAEQEARAAADLDRERDRADRRLGDALGQQRADHQAALADRDLLHKAELARLRADHERAIGTVRSDLASVHRLAWMVALTALAVIGVVGRWIAFG